MLPETFHYADTTEKSYGTDSDLVRKMSGNGPHHSRGDTVRSYLVASLHVCDPTTDRGPIHHALLPTTRGNAANGATSPLETENTTHKTEGEDSHSTGMLEYLTTGKPTDITIFEVESFKISISHLFRPCKEAGVYGTEE